MGKSKTKTKKKVAKPKTRQDMAEIARLGGLARKGTKNKKTLIREEAKKIHSNLVFGLTGKLTQAKIHLALGNYVSLYYLGIKVEDPETLDWYMGMKHFKESGGELEEEDEKKFKDYALISIHRPDGTAIRDLLDRAFGKAPQEIVQTNENGLYDEFVNVIDEATRIKDELIAERKRVIAEEHRTIDITAKNIKPKKRIQKVKKKGIDSIYLSAMNITGLKKEAKKFKIKLKGTEKKNDIINLITREL